MADVSQTGEPIAIIGMACRFPGAAGLTAFWRLLEEGGNAVTQGAPGSGVGRIGQLFPDHVEPVACRFGAYIEDLDLFDPAFFRISPVEAQLLDPQQRMMLEVCWQALEDAGIDPERLRGSRTGVYAGISNMEYRPLTLESSEPDAPAASLYALTGTTLNSVSGRVSFVLGLEGPTMAVDAACSSSLVSVHQAITGLQQGEADLALAGGVQAILDGRAFEVRAISGMLSSEGQCKAFDASADGFVRGEGCGMVVLKRLSEAEADGDRIWGIIRGSAVNHAGASAGLTVPHGPSQQKVIEEALSRAGVNPADVDYLEAHGTGTEVGDPIEIHAAVAAYGEGRDADRPLLVGSVKTNIGHLEPASGIAGLIKTALAMQRGVIPKQLHFRNPNPRVDWARLPIKITSEPTEWPQRPGATLLAGVSSYGISGTNSHVVVENRGTTGTSDTRLYGTEWVPGSARDVSTHKTGSSAEVAPADRGLHRRRMRFLPLSGKTEGALKDLAGLYLSRLDEHVGESVPEIQESEALADMAWTAGAGRSHFAHRAGVLFKDADSLRGALGDVAGSDTRPEPRQIGKVAFAYTGQGSQWVGMGRDLYETEPVARAIFDRCEQAFLEERGKSLLDVMFGRGEGTEDLSDTAWEQPALYALECALTALWSSVGIRPDVVVGHSVGELAACQAAGVFSLEDGMRLAAVRGALFSRTEPGSMAAVFASAGRVSQAIEVVNRQDAGVGLSLAADNGTHQVVSGPTEKIEAVSELLESEEVRVLRLNTSRAFHSALLDPVLGPLEALVNTLTISPPTGTRLVSNVSGLTVEENELLDGGYWARHARAPVAFASGVRTLAELGVDAILEIGPHSVLGPMASLCWFGQADAPNDSAPVVLASLRRPPRGETNPESGFIEAVAMAYEAGLDISFAGLFAGESRRRVSIPSYPFQRTRHWVEAARRRRIIAGHPLLGVKQESARGESIFESEISPSNPEWITDHRVFGRVVAPGAMYAAMAAMALRTEGTDMVVMEDVQLHSPLIFQEDSSDDRSAQETRQLQLVLDPPEGNGNRQVEIFSKGTTDESWTLHVDGRLSPGTPTEKDDERVDLRSLRSGLSHQGVSEFFDAKSDSGMDFGPAFRGLESLWCGTGEAVGEIALPAMVGSNSLDLHPLLIDGCFQVLSAARSFTGGENATAYMPFGWERLWLRGTLPDHIICHARIRESSQQREHGPAEPPETVTADIWLYDPSGLLIGAFTGFTSKRATRAALLSSSEDIGDLLHEIVWRNSPFTGGLQAADFLAKPSVVAAEIRTYPDYLTEEGVPPAARIEMLADLERLSHSYVLRSLDQLGWHRVKGSAVASSDLLDELRIQPAHTRLFARMLQMLGDSGVLQRGHGDELTVAVGSGESLPDGMTDNPDELAAALEEKYPDGRNEIGLLRRCGASLSEVLGGITDPLGLLFTEEGPSASGLYQDSPPARAAAHLLSDAIKATLSGLPTDRRLRVLEVGAGTGSGTAAVLPQLPEGRFDYVFTDISASFFEEAEIRFGEHGANMEYRPLNIELDPESQGYGRNEYDLVIAVNALHATRDLEESLSHCRQLLAPDGQLVAIEIMRGQSWQDLTFGLLDGWWRFDDAYRINHALVDADVWRRALGDTGYSEVEVLGAEYPQKQSPERGVIIAQGPGIVTEPPGTWILAADRTETALDVARELTARNQTVLIAGGETPGSESHGHHPALLHSAIDVRDREAWRNLLQSLPEEEAPLKGVIHLTATDFHKKQGTTAELQEDVAGAANSALALAQGLMDADAQLERGLWFVARGAQVLNNEPAAELAGATLWGFGRVVAREAPQLCARMVDLDPAESGVPETFINELLHPDSEHQIAYRQGSRQVARLVKSTGQTTAIEDRPNRVRQDRAYLVTGGLGGIGLAVAGWLAEQGAGAIVLNGRRPPDPEVEEAVAALRQQGARVHVELADVTDESAMQEMLSRIDSTLPPLGGVIHSVGVLSDASLENQSWASFERVLWPKVLGAWRLHRATEGRDLDLFVLFSSASGIRGNPGQANHAAANTFLDQLALHRRALGLPGQAIQWGSWAGLGEAEEQRDRISRNMEIYGSGWMTPTQGIRALDRLVRQDIASNAVASIDWSVFAANLPRPMPFIGELLPRTVARRADAQAPSGNLQSRLRETSPGERENLLAAFLQGELQALLRLPSAPSPTVGFFELGMDSLMAVQLRNRLNRAFSGEYTAPNTIVFDYPDISSLARHLAGVLAGNAEPQPERRPPELIPATREKENGIAIVGMACRFPGADSLEAYWRLLDSGQGAVSDDRPESGYLTGLKEINSGENPSYRRGAYIKGIDQFDAGFFRIAPIEARNMDPQQRLLLEASWQALEDAGIDPDSLRGSRTGVYAGIGNSEYRDLVRQVGATVNYLGTSGSMAVGRVAFVLGLEGPAIPVDLACASSLAAVHQAVSALQQGEVDMALAGGVNAVLSASVTREMAQIGMISPDGQCKTFDADADGYVRGEGCGMVVLKRLSDAEDDGDRIWGVIRGSAVNQNGVSAGPTVPNGPAQEKVIEEALSKAGVNPKDVDYLEAHGVGSNLGDPIEVQAAAAVYGRDREGERPLLVGSAKTNIGHLEVAAGIAALIKAVLSMKNLSVPKHRNFKNPTPHLEWDSLPIKVASEAVEWPIHHGRPPLAGVSAFGMQGSNTHVVVEGYGEPEDADNPPNDGPWEAGPARKVQVSFPDSVSGLALPDDWEIDRKTRFLPLSGKSGEALRDLACKYLAWLDERSGNWRDGEPADAMLADMAWTASMGRSHFANRAGIVFRDVETLRQGLNAASKPGEKTEAKLASGVAFRFSGLKSAQVAKGVEIYEAEPVARAVLALCDEVFREETGVSLLEVMLSQSGAAEDGSDPAWERPVLYALQCALSATLASAGIRPRTVAGRDGGELAAAQATGLLSIEEGMRLAVSGEASSILQGVPQEVSEANPGVDLVLDISPGRAFAEVVAMAYEAGADVSFAGLFAGETRRRISLPGYPFQRLSYWIESAIP